MAPDNQVEVRSKRLTSRQRWALGAFFSGLLITLYLCPWTSWLVGNRSYLLLRTIPVPTEAYEVSTATGDGLTGWRTNYRVDWLQEDVIRYYEEHLSRVGWRITQTESIGSVCLELQHLVFTSAEIAILPGNQRSFVSVYLPPYPSLCLE